jgi:hypothetical protein
VQPTPELRPRRLILDRSPICSLAAALVKPYRPSLPGRASSLFRVAPTTESPLSLSQDRLESARLALTPPLCRLTLGSSGKQIRIPILFLSDFCAFPGENGFAVGKVSPRHLAFVICHLSFEEIYWSNYLAVSNREDRFLADLATFGA